MKYNNSKFLFFCIVILISLVSTSCKAMKNNKDIKSLNNDNDKKELLKQNSNYEEFPNTFNIQKQEQEELNKTIPTPNKNKNQCTNWIFNHKVALFTLGITTSAIGVGYYYYSLLNKECHKMQNACDEAVDEVDNITKNVELLQAHFAEFIKFIKQCPQAKDEFMPEVLAFAEKCCKEQ